MRVGGGVGVGRRRRRRKRGGDGEVGGEGGGGEKGEEMGGRRGRKRGGYVETHMSAECASRWKPRCSLGTASLLAAAAPGTARAGHHRLPDNPFSLPHSPLLSSPCAADAAHLAWNRVCGILSGVVLIIILSILIFPKSASMECINKCDPWDTGVGGGSGSGGARVWAGQVAAHVGARQGTCSVWDRRGRHPPPESLAPSQRGKGAAGTA